MRHDPAPAEAKLWQLLRNRQLGGFKFRRQTPMPPFIADFYCAELKLIIELDGDSHTETRQYGPDDQTMPIEADRISQDIETIAGFNETTPDIGYSRPAFSPAWRAARDYVIAQAESAGCKLRIDAAGNVFVRHNSIDLDAKVWLSGSHIDSVPTGGKYDGVIGIVCPLEVLRTGKLPLELVIWAEEEGTTFGLGMIGSRLATGAETIESISQFKNPAIRSIPWPDRNPRRARPGHVGDGRTRRGGHRDRRSQAIQGQVHGHAQPCRQHPDALSR